MIHEVIDIKTDHSTARLTTYILDNFPEIDENRKRPLVVVCPGGGYRTTSDREAEPVAIRLNAMGFHAVVLRYNVTPAVFPTALLEVATTVAMVREKADEWNVDPDKIIVAGFSAGGHLAASLGVFWQEKFLADRLEVTNETIRPNGLLLSYPVITSGSHAHEGSFQFLLGEKHEMTREELSLEKRVTASTPRTFIWHTYDDEAVPVENALLFATALRKHNIPLELHIYPTGRHGLSLATEESLNSEAGFGIQEEVASWIDLAGVWMRNL